MVELLLFSSSEVLLHQWQNSSENSCVLCQEEGKLLAALKSDKKQIVLYDLQSFAAQFNTLILDIKAVNSLLFALTGTPSFKEGSTLLPQKISGYGNAYMSAGNLALALDIISEGQVWLYPDFVQELIGQASQENNPILTKTSMQSLTPKEQDVAHLVAQGKSNKELAQALNITERTVKAHLTHIYEKLQVSDRLNLALIVKG